MMFTLRRFSKPLNVTLAALLLACTMPAWADNEAQFKQAMTAYEAGHYSQALRLLQPLAQQDDAKAHTIWVCCRKWLGRKRKIIKKR